MYGAQEILDRVVASGSFRQLDYRERFALILDMLQSFVTTPEHQEAVGKLWGEDEAFDDAFRLLWPDQVEQLVAEALDRKELDEEDDEYEFEGSGCDCDLCVGECDEDPCS
jgi:hypothetical protein